MLIFIAIKITEMEIRILQLLEGARQAEGLTVIIDVFRAFTVAPWLFEKGAKAVIPVANVEDAFEIQCCVNDVVLVGERGEKKIPGFDFGNSPSLLMSANLQNKTIVHTTSSGTQGIAGAVNASEILTGSFVNASAIVKYIKKLQPEVVSLVCMGYACQYATEEDSYCAEYIAALLRNEDPPFFNWKEIIRETSGARFFDPSKAEWAPSSDFNYCMDLNRFDFVLKAEKQDDGHIHLLPIRC
jgi:2-phosphosulfolactate phosphatase